MNHLKFRTFDRKKVEGQRKTLGFDPEKIQPTSTSLKDAEKVLVGRCLAGEQKAWEEICRSYHDTVANVASWEKWRFDPHELEDVTQDIMLEIVTSLKNFKFKSDPRTFIYRIAVHTCIGRLKKKLTLKRINQSVVAHIDTIESGRGEHCGHLCVDMSKNQEELLLEKEMLHRIMRTLLRMDEDCKDLIMQRYFAEVPFQEIARKTGIKTNTLVIRLKRYLIRFQSILNEERWTTNPYWRRGTFSRKNYSEQASGLNVSS
ncbi:MAG: RNA polymerase sigma factor [Desulfomonilaceae bacterium]